jgi:hypothetical protein
VHIELAVTLAPMPARTGKPAARNDVVSEYGGAAVEKLLAEQDGDDDEYVPAVKA